MKTSIKYIERKTDGLRGIGRIARVSFSKTGKTIYYDGKSLLTLSGYALKANYFDEETYEEYWISNPRRDGNDSLFPIKTEIDSDAREEYNVLIRSGEARLVGWSRNMLYSGFITLHRSVVRRQTGFGARITRTLSRLGSRNISDVSDGNHQDIRQYAS